MNEHPDQAIPAYEDIEFRRNTIGWILVVLNLIIAVGSTGTFLFRLKVGVLAWFLMNSCAPSVFLLAIGFFGRSLTVMLVATVLMLRYAVGGLFVWGWEPAMIPAQAGHILMTLAGIYVLIFVIRLRAWKTLRNGLVFGIAILVPYMILQELWCRIHPILSESFMSGELMRNMR